MSLFDELPPSIRAGLLEVTRRSRAGIPPRVVEISPMPQWLLDLENESLPAPTRPAVEARAARPALTVIPGGRS